jgi:hypothetical protein
VKFNVKVVTKFDKRAVFEFDSRDQAFAFASACFDEANATLEDPVKYVAIAPQVIG